MNTNTPVRLKPECIPCIVDKHLGAHPANITLDEKIDYMAQVIIEAVNQ